MLHCTGSRLQDVPAVFFHEKRTQYRTQSRSHDTCVSCVTGHATQSHLLRGTSDLERCCVHFSFCIFLWWIYRSINPKEQQHLTPELFVPMPSAAGGPGLDLHLAQTVRSRIDVVAPLSTAGQGGNGPSIRIPFPIKFYTRHVKQIPSRTGAGNAEAWDVQNLTDMFQKVIKYLYGGTVKPETVRLCGSTRVERLWDAWLNQPDKVLGLHSSHQCCVLKTAKSLQKVAEV